MCGVGDFYMLSCVAGDVVDGVCDGVDDGDCVVVCAAGCVTGNVGVVDVGGDGVDVKGVCGVVVGDMVDADVDVGGGVGYVDSGVGVASADGVGVYGVDGDGGYAGGVDVVIGVIELRR